MNRVIFYVNNVDLNWKGETVHLRDNHDEGIEIKKPGRKPGIQSLER